LKSSNTATNMSRIISCPESDQLIKNKNTVIWEIILRFQKYKLLKFTSLKIYQLISKVPVFTSQYTWQDPPNLLKSYHISQTPTPPPPTHSTSLYKYHTHTTQLTLLSSHLSLILFQSISHTHKYSLDLSLEDLKIWRKLGVLHQLL
jgi:hypothetical protein